MHATEGVFNWDQYEHPNKKLGSLYTDQQREDMAALYGSTLSAISQYEVVKGSVISITHKDVIVGVGYKSDGLIAASEFRDLPDLKLGDEVEVYIEETENTKGQLVLSRKKAKLVRAWEKIQHALEHGEVLEGLVKRRTKGGLIVEVCDIETFLPGSQIDIRPVLDFDVFVGKTIDVVVIKINHTNDNVVVSHKALTEKKLEGQKLEIISNLEKGQILEGYVKNITKFGAFIDLGGVDGLLHKLDMAWSRVNHPEELFTLGQRVRVVVIGFNEDKKRISLGMKQLQEHPWDALPETLEVGSTIKGTITNIADYGLFIELMPGIEGFVYVLDISWSQYLRDINEHYKIGDTIEACILSLDRKNYKIALGIKQLTGDPWEHDRFLSTYAVGTTHEGVVRNLTHFGAFIELEPGIEGLLHVSRLSETKRVAHPSDVLKLGKKLEVIVLGISRENRRLSLGLKQENPWDMCEKIFQIGTLHKGTIVKKIPGRGAIVELVHGIEGQVAQHHFIKADGQEPEVGEELDFQVLKCAKADKKIILSHQILFNPEVEAKVESKTRVEAKGKIEKAPSTRGFEAFANLKEKLEQHTKKESKE
ncbi:30S ribosomal protein S1 [Cardinium endosymbiont of Bemisia tabaci]|uniref:30S ribosomal protein S1 n=1 Tax=Cardinium endosymbiont of Bemisia tabaci TaxID=672794 RepID=UPI000442D020|nr:30S ribosomal protein S1 [Cardinium endosymbiont of Bemisia tabaci]CDG49484.1 30S ribosomal protein S1 [Cardinium endosymbiont cBtQ1 of Bemisia tabaci]